MSLSEQILLTIAIPTYNRCNILDESLNKLLPQIIKFNNCIEIIISDNDSKDNTQEVIQKHKKKYEQLNFVTYKQPENTGYYGNFKKCRELSNGKYLWLLSDNEHVENGVISSLIMRIQDEQELVGVYYLEDQIKETNMYETNNYEITHTNFNQMILNETAWLLTSISAVVLLNIKQYDEEAVSMLEGNPFIGFIFLCNSLRINNKITIIKGNIYTYAPCKVYFDITKAWTTDIMDCVDYMLKCELLTKESEIKFVQGFLKTNVQSHVINFRLSEKYNLQTTNSRKEIKKEFDSFYLEYPYYKKYISHLFLSPRIIIQTYNVLRKINNIRAGYIKKFKIK